MNQYLNCKIELRKMKALQKRQLVSINGKKGELMAAAVMLIKHGLSVIIRKNMLNLKK